MDDLISRQAAIDAIEEYADRLQMLNWKENPNVPYKAYTLNWCINTIRELPSAQPKHGKWELKTSPTHHHIGYQHCSVCGCPQLEATPFCPNCGADMRGKNDV